MVLSGVEPQRSMLESQILNQLENYSGEVFFVRGVFDSKELTSSKKDLTIKNYLLSTELEMVLNQSNIVLARSGYSTIMDLAVLGKKSFFIPTPGQTEQEYLAFELDRKGLVPFSNQHEFSVENLIEIENFSGFNNHKSTFNLNIFSLF